MATRKAQNKGKRATPSEISTAISEYLQGDPISEIAKGLFRSPGFVRAIIEKVGVPTRPTSSEARSHIALLPDACVSEVFRLGEIAWSAKYHAPCVIKNLWLSDAAGYSCNIYQIYVLEKVDSTGSYFEYLDSGGFYAYAPCYDLGNLDHLIKYGADILKI